MQKAMQHSWAPASNGHVVVAPRHPAGGDGGVRGVVEGSAAVVVGRSGCCMSHVARRLLQALGANPVVFEIAEGSDEEAAMIAEITVMDGGDQPAEAAFPVVFVGGKLIGGLDRLMAVHISGELVPILKEAGALWL